MLRKLHRKRKGQNTAEYAILISLVVAAVIAMQTYVQRGLQAKMRDAVANYMDSEIDAASPELGATLQYEPYYLETSFNVTRDSSMTTYMTKDVINGVGQMGNSSVIREDHGFQSFDYDTGITGIHNGI